MDNLNEDSRYDRLQAFAIAHANTRIRAGKSQEYMAMELGVSKKTVQNWEKGISSPTFFQSLEWFRILKTNPIPYYMSCTALHKNIRGYRYDPDDKIEAMFDDLTKQFSINTKRALVYLFLGEHGSSPVAVLNLMLAHLHTPMKARSIQARLILDNYILEKETGNLICPDNILPDDELLNDSIERAKMSVIQHYQTYDPVDPE